MNDDAVRHFFRTYGATAVGPTPPQPTVPESAEGEEDEERAGGEGPGYEPPHYPEVRIGAQMEPSGAANAIEKALMDAGFLGGAENVYQGDEEERVKERLRNLGYID